MNALFQPDVFVIKRKKLSTGKLRVFSGDDTFLMYAEQKVKWTPPFTATVRIWADEQKQQELLVATDAGGREYDNFLEVTDTASGEVLGGLGMDGGFIKDAWIIMNAQGDQIAAVTSSAGRSFLRMAAGGAIAQKLDVTVGSSKVATMNQKHALIGNHLRLEIAPGASAMIDKRLLVAAAVLVAAYLANEDLD